MLYIMRLTCHFHNVENFCLGCCCQWATSLPSLFTYKWLGGWQMADEMKSWN